MILIESQAVVKKAAARCVHARCLVMCHVSCSSVSCIDGSSHVMCARDVLRLDVCVGSIAHAGGSRIECVFFCASIEFSVKCTLPKQEIQLGPVFIPVVVYYSVGVMHCRACLLYTSPSPRD